jgi:hypothetical protein
MVPARGSALYRDRFPHLVSSAVRGRTAMGGSLRAAARRPAPGQLVVRFDRAAQVRGGGGSHKRAANWGVAESTMGWLVSLGITGEALTVIDVVLSAR